MLQLKTPKTNSNEFSRCEERIRGTNRGENLTATEKTDVALKDSITAALWKDAALQVTEYDEIDIQVKNGIVYLSGHIVSVASQSRIENAIRTVTGIKEIKNNLVLDDKLTLEISTALSELERAYDCKFFAGASHGVVSVDGIVGDVKVKLLAEQCAANNPHVRGVINNIRISRTEFNSQSRPFLQPVIGELIYFLDGVSGVVKQVIINPNNRRVIALVIERKFANWRDENNLLSDSGILPLQVQHITVPVSMVRYLTKVSGFLHILSSERKQYMDFDPAHFAAPNEDWIPPYPYCPSDVLFPIEYQDVADAKSVSEPDQFLFEEGYKNAAIGKNPIVNDGLGG